MVSTTNEVLEPLALSELERLQTVLQAGHDRIEIEGFDIGSFGLVDEKGAPVGPACYIGTVRIVTGARPCPVYPNASIGDGPELVQALRLLDSVVPDDFPLDEWSPDQRGFDGEEAIGRYIEGYGFAYDHEYGNEDEERDEALRIFRVALTAVHEHIEEHRAFEREHDPHRGR